MHPSEIRAQIGLDKIPPFKLEDIDRSHFLSIKLQDRSGAFFCLVNSDIDQIEVALRILSSADHMYRKNKEAQAPLGSKIDNRIKAVVKSRKHLLGLIDLFCTMEDKEIAEFAMKLYRIDCECKSESDQPNLRYKPAYIKDIFRTIKTITRNPCWFDGIIESRNRAANRKGQDLWLNFTLDELCDVLRNRAVVLTRNPHSAPFGLVLDALALVRPGDATAQIDSYLKITRQGVGKSSFGRRWGEIADDLPKTEMDLS